MKIWQMSFLVLGAGLFNSMLSNASGIIPSKEEQTNLLTNVQEVFEQVRLLVNVEANSSNESVASDMNKVVQRAKDKLVLTEKFSLMKMSCNSNSVCTLEYKPIIHNLVQEGGDALMLCLKQCSRNMSINSVSIKNSTEFATECGQNFIDTLYDCSRKPGLQVVSCYKDVIAKDVIPLKKTLLGAIDAHKEGYLRTIGIRDLANSCVDDVLQQYETKIAAVVQEALHCI